MKLLLAFFLLAWGCGDDEKPKNYQKKSGSKYETQFRNSIVPLLNKNCIACHSTSSFTKGADLYLSSKARDRVANGSMPPSGSSQAGQITEGERQIMYQFPK